MARTGYAQEAHRRPGLDTRDRSNASLGVIREAQGWRKVKQSKSGLEVGKHLKSDKK